MMPLAGRQTAGLSLLSPVKQLGIRPALQGEIYLKSKLLDLRRESDSKARALFNVEHIPVPLTSMPKNPHKTGAHARWHLQAGYRLTGNPAAAGPCPAKCAHR